VWSDAVRVGLRDPGDHSRGKAAVPTLRVRQCRPHLVKRRTDGSWVVLGEGVQQPERLAPDRRGTAA
jgi:hypothetical protein